MPFKFNEIEGPGEEAVYEALREAKAGNKPTHAEWDSLISRLDLRGVEYEKDELDALVFVGRVEFDSPRGRVVVEYTPLSVGYPRKLAAQSENDTQPRAMTALQIMEDYFWGGW